MKVLADFHHDSLWWSLHLVLVRRFGWELYRPIGMDWYDQGYYRLYGHLRMPDPYRWIAELYLSRSLYNYDPATGTAIGVEARKGCVDYPVFHVKTLAEAKDTDWDFIFCTVRENEPYFKRFRDEYAPRAKLVRVSGNQYDEIDAEAYPNAMISAISTFRMCRSPNKVLYHQEFDLDLFKYEPPRHTHNIYAFMNDLGEDYREGEATAVWYQHEHDLPEFTFRSYGGRCEYGRIYPKRALVAKMLQASFIWHLKWIDGYGHILFNAACLGRPVLTHSACYKDKIGEPLLVPGETCLWMDDPDFYSNLRRAARMDRLRRMSEAMRRRFLEVVDFTRDAENIFRFLQRCR